MVEQIKNKNEYRIETNFLLSNGKIKTTQLDFAFEDMYEEKRLNQTYSIWEVNKFYCGEDNPNNRFLSELIEDKLELSIKVYVKEIFDIKIIEKN